MLLVHWIRRAASRADWTAGNKSAISTAMMAITTRSSITVKPCRRIEKSPQYKLTLRKKNLDTTTANGARRSSPQCHGFVNHGGFRSPADTISTLGDRTHARAHSAAYVRTCVLDYRRKRSIRP